jgi:lipopolysaccharide transport system ATP-binding protein
VTSAIRVCDLTKTFARASSVGSRSLKEAVLTGSSLRRPRRDRIAVLQDVSLDVAHGQTVGIIGHNGAGKSTLLRLIAGVGKPDAGTIEVAGRLGALFEIGVGFHPELTGRESVLVAGVVAGLSREQVRARMDEIAAFAELEDSLDEPIRTYSTGMQARLAFSLATVMDPEVLLVDEVLAVGDLAFQARCYDRLRAMQRAGTTILLVSHDPVVITDLCDTVVWLRGGRLVGQGPPREVTERYRADMAEETRRITPEDVPEAVTPAGRELRIHDNRFGSQRGVIARVDVLDGWGVAAERIPTGGQLRVVVTAHVPLGLGVAHLGVTLTRSDGVVCLDSATPLTGSDNVRVAALDVGRLDLAAGDYSIDVGLYDEHWAHTFDYHWRAYPLRIDGPAFGPSGAVLAPPLSWSVASRPVARSSD